MITKLQILCALVHDGQNVPGHDADLSRRRKNRITVRDHSSYKECMYARLSACEEPIDIFLRACALENEEISPSISVAFPLFITITTCHPTTLGQHEVPQPQQLGQGALPPPLLRRQNYRGPLGRDFSRSDNHFLRVTTLCSVMVVWVGC